MKRLLVILFAVMLIFGATGKAFTAVLDFEDLYQGYETYAQLPAGYGGFTWNDDAWYVTDQYFPGSGYDYGTIGQVSLFGAWADDVIMTSSVPFDFIGAYITAAWNSSEEVVIEGWTAGTQTYSETIETSVDGPYWWDFNFLGVDEVRFRSLPEDGTGGVHILL